MCGDYLRQSEYSSIDGKHQIVSLAFTVDVRTERLKLDFIVRHDVLVPDRGAPFNVLEPAAENSQTGCCHRGIRSHVPSRCGSCSNLQTNFPDGIARCRST